MFKKKGIITRRKKLLFVRTTGCVFTSIRLTENSNSSVILIDSVSTIERQANVRKLGILREVSC